MTNIIIMGAGELGSAIGKILKEGKAGEITFWDKNPAIVIGQKSLAETVPTADFLLMCVPSWAMREAVKDVGRYLTGKTTVISFAKGMEPKTMDDLLDEVLPSATAEGTPIEKRFAILSGPMIAEELAMGKQGMAVVACADRKIYSQIRKIFKDTNISLEYSSDVKGVALAGTLKNIYSVGLGIIDAMELGGNAKGWFAAKAEEEMAEIISVLGGKKKTALGVAGLGDLVTTGFSDYSRNKKAGGELIQTGKCCLRSEGTASIAPIYSLLGDKAKDFELLSALYRVLAQGENSKSVFGQILNNLK
ncbi:MAG: 2-dehydropantoate 2-reductase N-terminal domain-containing protein [Candidatus Pacebacteria bacterium]|nr:2-dehydropantoate 2-reductase N-terminal domain-containing protein [Candidatus Paceibacterota bacterium]